MSPTAKRAKPEQSLRRNLNNWRRGFSESLEDYCKRLDVKCTCDPGPPLSAPRRHFWNHKEHCVWNRARATWQQWGRVWFGLKYEGENKS